MHEIAEKVFTYIKRELTIILYLAGLSFAFISIKIEHVVSPKILFIFIFLTVFLCVIPLGLDLQIFLNKFEKYKKNIFVSLSVKFFKYALFCLIAFIVIKTTNLTIFNILGENPKNYPATLASLTIIITPLMWISSLITFASILSILLPIILLIFFMPLHILSIVNISNYIKASFWKIFFRVLMIVMTFIIISAFAQGASKFIFRYYDKLVSIVILETAFYKNDNTCKNLQSNNLIAFTDLREEVILYLETKDNKIKSKKTECIR